jgi:hypothetical protein
MVGLPLLLTGSASVCSRKSWNSPMWTAPALGKFLSNEPHEIMTRHQIQKMQFEQAHLRDGVPVAAAGHNQRRNNGQGERNFHTHRRALSGMGLQVDGAPIFSILVLTTSMPMPLPETLVIFSAVERNRQSHLPARARRRYRMQRQTICQCRVIELSNGRSVSIGGGRKALLGEFRKAT